MISVGGRLDDHLLDLGRMLSSDADRGAVLDRVLETARELTDARYAAVGVLNERRDGLAALVTRGMDEETRRAIGRPPCGRGVLGDLIIGHRPVRLPDIAGHPAGHGFPPGHPAMSSFLGVPIMIDGRAEGNLYVTEKRDGEFTADDERVLETLAAWAGLAIRSARPEEAGERRGEQTERALIAARRAGARSQAPAAYVARFVDALRAVDGRRAEAVAREALDGGLELAALYARVVAPAMYRIGELWARGVITVADEHAATAVAHGVLAAVSLSMYDFPPLGRTVLLAAPEGERHTLGLRMAADVFEQQRYHVIYLGADVPAESLVQSVAGHRPALTGLSLTIERPDRQITDLLQAIRRAHSDTHILIGGQGVPERRFDDGVSYVATVESLVAQADARPLTTRGPDGRISAGRPR